MTRRVFTFIILGALQLGTILGKEYTVSNFGVSASTLLKKGNKPY